jgi:two-component system response regulator YesN
MDHVLPEGLLKEDMELLKLMLAEDEALEKKALRFLVKKFYSGTLQIVCEVTNGRDAVDKALELKPDIILMDINMPIIDGLDAGASIKSSCKETKIIIVSAFNYFNYAKKAISLGVSDYLLKPYSNEEFCASIDKVIYKIDEEKSTLSKNKEVYEKYEKYEKSIPLVEKEMVTNIVYGVMLTEEELEEYKRFLDISIKNFCCVIFKTEKSDTISMDNIQRIKKKLKILFSNVIGYVCLNDFVVFLFDDAVDEKILSGRFEKMIHEIKDEYKDSEHAALYFGLGCSNEKVDELYISYTQAKLDVEKTKKIIRGKENDEADSTSIYSLKDKIVSISGEIINEDLEGALNESDNLLSLLINENKLDDSAAIEKMVKKVFKEIINNAIEFLGEEYKELGADSLFEDMPSRYQVTDIKYYEHMIVKNLIRYITIYKKSKNINMVEKVKRYIESNYMKEISLGDMSRYICISSYYLSRIFKKVEGTNFRDYLIKVRMEKAKNILKKEGKSIKEVSIEVGYSNQNYFSNAFKKYTHLSPKEYVNL